MMNMNINDKKLNKVSKRYGIYNTKAKQFQFGINESSKKKAINKLFQKIGKDAYKWRFIVKEIKV